MIRILFLTLIIGIGLMTCTQPDNNPFYAEWDTPYQVPPFDQIEDFHFMPALLKGIDLEKVEIDVIVNNPDMPTYGNTIEALEKTGQFLTKVENVFYNLSGSIANDELDQIARDYEPLSTIHRDNIILNVTLFDKIKTIYNAIDKSALSVEQNTLLEKTYKDFVRNGANLDESQKDTLRKINEELSLLTLEFGQNVRKENNTWTLVLESEDDLVGLSESIKAAAADLAEEKGHDGKWVITLDKPSWIPFLQYSERRDLREIVLTAYMNRGNNNDETDNKERIKKIVHLRIKRANILGYDSHSEYVLERNMAKNPNNVYSLLKQLWEPALNRAKAEANEYQEMIYQDGHDYKLQPWDWWYYAEKMRQEKFALDDNLLRPYFEVNNVVNGVFSVTNKLYGLIIKERTDIPIYHEDVKTYEVQEADGTHIGIFYTDYHPRKGKDVGAWSSTFRSQSNREGNWISPVVVNVGNFTKPTDSQPALLSMDEVETLFHEFGHALHSLLRFRTYTNQLMPRDFVELPSQIMENWAVEPVVLKEYALHYETGEPIPDELIEKLQNARLHNLGFETVEYLAACLLDMDWHTLTEVDKIDPLEFEDRSLNAIGLIPEIESRYRSTYFNHVFSWGYSSGYYSYIWAEVLDADAFNAFKQTDLFNQDLANKFRKYVLGLSGTDDIMKLYRQFRGQDPEIQPLLDRRGLN
ncbi:M3 family metallopeptidase [Candidatus Neomarinimicrobiota bacterium]